MSRPLLTLVPRPGEQGTVVQRAPGTAYYRSLSGDELKVTVAKLLDTIDGNIGRITAAVRDELLPVLMVLKGRMKHGEWEPFLLSHRLKPATVRKWRARERAATKSLLELLGEPPEERRRKREELTESAAVQLAKAGKRLAEAVLRKDTHFAAQQAMAYLEAYEDSSYGED